MELKELQTKIIEEIPTLDQCLSNEEVIPDWKTLSESIYQCRKALFLLKKIASNYHWDTYRFEGPNFMDRMINDGIKINQQVYRNSNIAMPEKI
ncbi:MAG: hypothetical protein DRH37_01205 [Deltaproteobacteria bacterium]|nr:MAG: hypothetical protein DRH37_01205 [Deltaproteobacteria bacterium]